MKNFLDKVLGSSPSDIQSPDDQTYEEKELIGWVRSRLEEYRAASSRIYQEATWLTNTAYALGFSDVYYDAGTKTFKPLDPQRRVIARDRLRTNKILSRLQNRQSRLLENPPKFDVRPESSDVEDKDASRLAVQILTHYYDKEQLETKRNQMTMWAQQTGHAYLHVYWDETKGRVIQDKNGEVEFEGDVAIEVASPFEIYPDPIAKSIDDCQSIIRAKVRKLDYFKAQYPERGHLVRSEDVTLLGSQFDQRINTLTTAGSGTNNLMAMKDCALEVAYYERRSKKHPNGRLVIVASGVLLHDDELPCGEFPFAKFDDIVIGGRYYPESVVTHARPIQDQINRLISKRAEWTNKLLAGKYMAPRGSNLIQEALNDRQGEVVEYDHTPGTPEIKAMQLPVIPQYAYTEEERLDVMLDDIFGINEASRGVIPSASIPAVGMQLLIEQDARRIGAIIVQHEQAYARTMSLVLKYISKFVKTPRILKIAGRQMEYAVKEFVGADIKNNTDVITISGSTRPQSKTLRRQELLNLYSQGLLGQPGDPSVTEKLLDQLEVGDLASVYTKVSLTKKNIRDTLEAIEKDQMPSRSPSKFDNHKMWISEMDDYRLSDKYLNLSDAQRQVFDEIMDMHVKMAMPIMPPPPEIGMPPAPSAPPEVASAETTSSDIQPPLDASGGALI